MKWARISAKKIALGAVSIATVASFGLLFFNQQPAQAASAKWLNRFYIQVDSKLYFDQNTYDNVYEYVEQGAADSCADKIVFTYMQFGSPTNAGDLTNLEFFYSDKIYNRSTADTGDVMFRKQLITRTPAEDAAGRNTCTDQSAAITPSGAENRRVVFYERESDKKIVHITKNVTFSPRGAYPSGSGNTRYFRDDEVASNKRCVDMIIRHTARVLDDSIFGQKEPSGSSILFAVDDRGGLGRTSESYGPNSGLNTGSNPIGSEECKVDGGRVNGRASENAYGIGGLDQDDDEKIAAAGLNADGTSSTGANYRDDAFIVFIGTEAVNKPKDASIPPPGETPSGTIDDQACKGGALGWIICPIVSAIRSMASLLKGLMGAMLTVNPLSFDSNDAVYTAWNNIRNFTNILFVIGFLFVVFSQATSLGISNYGAKRLLPNLVVGAVLANLSYPIVAMMIDISNITGVGIYNLIAIINGGSQGTVDVGNGSGAILTGVTATGAIAAFVSGSVVQLFPLLVTAALGLLVTFLLLIFRQMAIMLIAVFSSLIVAGKLRILPGLEGPADKAIDFFVGMLALYPLTMGLFGVARFAESVLTNAVDDGLLGSLIGAVSLVIEAGVAIAFIFLFKFAMVSRTAIGRLAGKINGSAKGLVNRAEEFGKNSSYYQRRQKAKESKQRQRQYSATEDYARALQRDDWRGRALRRRAGGYFNPLGQQRALADVHSVVDKQFMEDKQRARAMMSLNAARAFADAGSDQARLQSIIRNNGTYTTRDKKLIGFSSQDQEAISNLSRAGFLNGTGNRAGAAAALDELFDQQFIEKSDINNLAQVAGTDVESAGLMTKTISEAAARNKYKNFVYGAIESGTGQYVQYQPGPKTKDGLRIVESGVSGAPKEIFDDSTILAGLAHKTRDTLSAEQRQAAIVDVARQTIAVDKEGTIASIANAVGLDKNTFVELRQAIQTNTLGSSNLTGPGGTGRIMQNVQPMAQRPQEIKRQLKVTYAKRQAANELSNDLNYIPNL